MTDQNPESEAENDEDETVIVGNLRRTNTVQTAYPLLAVIQRARYSMSEYKILATYMSRINSQNPNSTVVSFPLSEYQELAGLPNLKPSDMKKYIAGLNKDIEVPPECAAQLDPGFTKSQEGYGYINLFGARFVSRKESGKWVVEIKCSDDAKKLFFFDLEQTRYVACLLDHLIDLTHMTTCYLYFRLKQMAYRGTFDIPLDILRDDWLCLSESETYKNFKYFKRDVLEVAVAEINEKTDLLVDYVPIKKRRSVVSIQFQVKDKPKRKKIKSGGDTVSCGIVSENPRDIYEQIELPYVDPNTPTAVMITEISGGAFTEKEVSEIEEVLCKKIPDETDSAGARRQDLLRDSYAEMMRREQTGTDVEDRCLYLIGIIKKTKGFMRSPEGSGYFSLNFQKFWDEYPRKEEKNAASEAYNKYMLNHPDVTSEQMVQAARLYRYQCADRDMMFIRRVGSFLRKEKDHPDGLIAEFLDKVEAQEKKEKEQKAREATPEYQAEKKKLDEFLQNRIHLGQAADTEKTAEPTTDTDTAESAEPASDAKTPAGADEAAKLKAYWRKIRPSGFKWTEDEEKEIDDQIEDCLKRCSSGSITAVLKSAVKYHEKMPRFDLAGIIQPRDVQDVQVPEMQ